MKTRAQASQDSQSSRAAEPQVTTRVVPLRSGSKQFTAKQRFVRGCPSYETSAQAKDVSARPDEKSQNSQLNAGSSLDPQSLSQRAAKGQLSD